MSLSPAFDPLVLGRILTLQSSLQVAPDESRLIQMLVHCLAELPAVESVVLCVEGEIHSTQGAQSHTCPHRNPLTSPNEARCSDCPHFSANASYQMDLATLNRRFGSLFLFSCNGPELERYLPFASNTVNLVALHIENRRRAVELESLNAHLDEIVRERTRQLREQQERYREIFEESDAGYFLIDREGLFRQVNPAWLRLHGYDSDAEILGRHYSLFQPDTGRESAQQMVAHLLAGGAIRSGEASRLRRDGTIAYHSFSATPVWRDGEIVGLEGFIIDQTERLEAEAALRERDEILRIAGRVARFGGWRVDFQENRLSWSDQVALIHGMPVGFSPSLEEGINFYVPEHRPRIEEVFRQCAEQGLPYDEKLEILAADGNRVWVRTIGEPVRDASGRIVGVQGAFQDISERMRVEREFETLFRQMLDGFALHEIILDEAGQPADYRFLAVNPAFERMTGLSASDTVGRTVLEVMPETEHRWIETYGRVALTGEPITFEDFSQVLDRHFEVTAFRPAPQQFACIFADITARKRAEEERERLQAQLNQSQRLESLGRLAGGVAHDFNNMLGVILGYTELALEQVRPGDPLWSEIGEIKAAAERSAELTRQLLGFARRQTAVPHVIDLNEALEDTLKLLRRLIGEDIDLVWRPGSAIWPVKLDPSQLHQILTNLCANARDAINGVGTITIETAARTVDEEWCERHPPLTPGDYVLLTISDSGCGMDRETLQHLFEPFFTTKPLGKGVGLGLATVYGIVQQNRGFINAYSEPGQGTSVYIYLPRHDTPARRPDEAAKKEISRGHETILLVEDELAILNLTKRLLERLGYSVLPAESPREAVDLTLRHEGRIDLLMTDVVMPGMNGRDLAKQISQRFPEVKFLFMSGYTANVIAHQGILDPGIHFIQKPFSVSGIATKLREVLDARPEPEANPES